MSEGGIISGRTVQGTLRLEADVAIIGSGAGGAVAAYELSKAGKRVVVLEAGKHVRPEDFTQREIDTLERVYVDGGGQVSASGAVNVLQGACIGGSTVINGEVCFRTPDFVLHEWATRYGVPGLSSGTLAPVFEDVERMINVTTNEGRYLEPGRKMEEGMRALGIEVKPIARNVDGCRGCPYCFFGCAYGCKQSMDQSYLPAAAREGATIYSEARVEVLRMGGPVATGVRARTPYGFVDVDAKATIVACGAIQTPLMLLDHGLGGAQVGHHLAVHPVFFASGVYDEAKPEQLSTMLATYSDAFMDRGFLLECGSGSRAFGAVGAPGFGRAHKELARRIKNVWGGGAIVRDSPGPGRVKRGKKGDKVIEYDYDEATKRKIRDALKTMTEILLASGAHEVYFATVEPRLFRTRADIASIDRMPLGPADIAAVSYHPQGTARMGVVTDHDGRVKSTDNLYVMDASLFPTPVGVNPQVSVMALSALLARRLAGHLG